MPAATLDDDFEIRVQFVPAENMRYDTLGDYRWDQGDMLIQIKAEGTFMERMAILLHELAEWAIVHEEGIPLSWVDSWDFSHPNSEEPGEEPGCPYGYAHTAAMDVENTFRAWSGNSVGKEVKPDEEDSASKYLDNINP